MKKAKPKQSSQSVVTVTTNPELRSTTLGFLVHKLNQTYVVGNHDGCGNIVFYKGFATDAAAKKHCKKVAEMANAPLAKFRAKR